LITSYSLLLFEHNVRSATILGLVGAGGVGFILTKYISLFQYRDLMGALILVIVMVTIIDRLSDFLRKKLI
jgi:phosphonate transport system permease protein